MLESQEWLQALRRDMAHEPVQGLQRLGQHFPLFGSALTDLPFPLNETHAAIGRWPVEGALVRGPVKGFLRPDDALALYQLAYCAQGDVLELGSAWGLSTGILCAAVRDSGRQAKVLSMELDAAFQRATKAHMLRSGFERQYHAWRGDATVGLASMVRQGRRFGLCFVDHDHSLQATREVCATLPVVLHPGAIAVFHDFNDERNASEPQTYGVYLGVCELLRSRPFRLVTVVGCCAVVRFAGLS